MKGEIHMAGYDGRVLAFMEVKTRLKKDGNGARPVPTAEEAVDREKCGNVARMARQFLRARRIEGQPYRFDVLAIETRPGAKPAVRLHRGAYTA
jgi:Holliday junction resolvase-like predicted endonuclease